MESFAGLMRSVKNRKTPPHPVHITSDDRSRHDIWNRAITMMDGMDDGHTSLIPDGSELYPVLILSIYIHLRETERLASRTNVKFWIQL